MNRAAEAYDTARRWGVLTLVAIELVAAPGLTPFHLGLSALSLLTVGVPHGALDAWMWRRATGRRAGTAFFAGYLALVTGMLACWWISPALAFATFIGISVWHFGATGPMAAQRRVFAWSRGALVVGVPILGHPEAVEPVLQSMRVGSLTLSESGAEIASTVLVGQHLVVLALTPDLDRATRRREAVQAVVLSAMFVVLHPLLSFSLFFALWHGVAHLLEMKVRFGGDDSSWVSLLFAGLPFALPPMLALVGAAAWLAPNAGDPSQVAGVALVGISGLTVPHALLVAHARWRLHRRRRPTRLWWGAEYALHRSH